MPLSARASLAKRPSTVQPTAVAATSSAPASARGCSRDEVTGRDGAVTPLTQRAQEYYSRLLGERPSTEGGIDTRQDWRLVEEISCLDHIRQEELTRRREKERALEQQAHIKAQLEKRNMIAEQCRNVWRQWGAEMQEDALRFKREEEQKKVENKEVQKKNREELERHLEEAKQQKVLQKEKERQLEREIMQKAEEMTKRQEEKEQKVKQEQRKTMQRVIVDAREQARMKREEKAAEVLKDKRDQDKYAEYLDKQDAERGKHLHEMRERQQALFNKYEQGVGINLANIQAQEEERARKQQEERYRKQEEAHKKEERWRQELRADAKASIDKQIALQAAAKQKVVDEDNRYYDQKRKEAKIAEANEAEMKRKKKEAIQENAGFLLKQITDNKQKGPKVKVAQGQMNDVERKMNRDRLLRACDPQRPDGLPELLRRKREEYAQVQRAYPTSMPC